MPAEATIEHEHRETVPDLPTGDLVLCLRGGGDDETVATSRLPLEPNHPANEQAADPAAGSDAGPGDIYLRFDRLEGRLSSLEQMIGELLNQQHQAATHPATTDHPPQVKPFPAVYAEADIPAVRKEPSNPEVMPDARQATETVAAGNLSPCVSSSPASAPPVASATQPAAAEPDAPQVPLWAQRKDDEELDQSVREYIERLLKQVRTPTEEPAPAAAGDSAEQQSNARPAPAAAAEPPSAASEENVPEAAAADAVEGQPAIVPAPSVLAPLRLPPERESNLDAMREVANLSANAAIRTFEKHEAVRKTFDRLPLLLIGLVCGLMLLYSAFSSGKSDLFVGAGAAFLAAALTAWQVLVVARRWLWASPPLNPERHEPACRREALPDLEGGPPPRSPAFSEKPGF